MDARYLIVSDHYWSKADMVTDAWKGLIKAGASKIDEWTLYKTHPGMENVRVDGMGMICWEWSDEAMKLIGLEELDHQQMVRVGRYQGQPRWNKTKTAWKAKVID